MQVKILTVIVQTLYELYPTSDKFDIVISVIIYHQILRKKKVL